MQALLIPRFGIDHLTLVESPIPEPGPQHVQIRMEAVSLNHQDLKVIDGIYLPDLPLPHIPASDGAGVITRLGPGVARWQVGDRVMIPFFQDWVSGPGRAGTLAARTGVTRPGLLAEYVVLPEHAPVRIPDCLTAVEAATLPAAGLTAWVGLMEHGRLQIGQTVLTQGTGGVSIAAVQIAKMAGAQVIATSGSDEKLAKLTALGADAVLNYRIQPDWVAEVRRLTGGEGVHIALDVAGGTGLAQSMRAVRPYGVVPFVGLLDSSDAQIDVLAGLASFVRLQGYMVGNRQSLEEYARALTQTGVQPVVDRTFPLAQVQSAYRYLEAGQHFGKVVVTI